MAKKAVATFSGDRAAKRNTIKCIRMDRSERTGAYVFVEQNVPVSETKNFFSKK